MSSPLDPDGPAPGESTVVRELRELARELGALSRAARAGQRSDLRREGSDDSKAVSIVVDGSTRVRGVRVDHRWRDHLAPTGVGEALRQAYGRAVTAVFEAIVAAIDGPTEHPTPAHPTPAHPTPAHPTRSKPRGYGLPGRDVTAYGTARAVGLLIRNGQIVDIQAAPDRVAAMTAEQLAREIRSAFCDAAAMAARDTGGPRQ